MAFWSNFSALIGSIFQAETPVRAVGIALCKSDLSADLLQSDGSGAAKVAIDATQLSGLATQTTAAANLEQNTQPTIFTAVTASDSTVLTTLATKGLLIGGAGNLACRLVGASSTTVTLAVQTGQFVPGQFTRVMAATTATGIVALS